MVEIKSPLDNAVIKYTPVFGRVEVPTRDFEDRFELEVSDTETSPLPCRETVTED